MFTRFSANIQGIILGFIGFAFFSMADMAAKFLTQFYPVFQIVGLESLFTLTVCLLLANPLGGLGKTLKTKQFKIHLMRALCNTAITMLIITSFSKLPMTMVYTLIFISPFLTAMMAIPAYREKIDRHGWIAIAAGFAGVLIVMRPGFAEFNVWLLLPMAAALFTAAGFLLSRAIKTDETLLSMAAFPALISSVILTPLAFLYRDLPQAGHIVIFMLGGAAIVGGLIFLALAFQRGKSSIVAPIQYTQILWGAGFSYLVFGDIPDLWTLAGAALIIGSGVYLLETERNLKTK